MLGHLRLASIAVLALQLSCETTEESPTPCFEQITAADPRAELLGEGVASFEIAIDDVDIYLADNLGLARLSKAGGGPPKILYSGTIGHLTVDAQAVYWSEQVAKQGVFRMDKASLEVRQLASDDGAGDLAADGDMPASIARGLGPVVAASEFIYWTSEKAKVVRRLHVTDPAAVPEIVSSGQEELDSIQVDRDRVYWSAGAPPSIRSAPLAGGAVETVTMPRSPLDFTIDAADVFFGDALSVARFPKSAGAIATVEDTPASGLAADGARLFWSAHDRCEIRTLEKSSGVLRVVASGQRRPAGVATDATHVYWSNWVGKTVMRAAK